MGVEKPKGEQERGQERSEESLPFKGRIRMCETCMLRSSASASDVC